MKQLLKELKIKRGVKKYVKGFLFEKRLYTIQEKNGWGHGSLDENDVVEDLGYHIGQRAVVIHRGRCRGMRVGVLGLGVQYNPKRDGKVDFLKGIRYQLIKSEKIYRLTHWLKWKIRALDPVEFSRKKFSMLKYYLNRDIKYKFKPWMGEISGFGGSYEVACRTMLNTGLLWLENNGHKEIRFSGSPQIYGVISEETDGAKELSEAVVKVADDCTGAMHQAVVSRCLWIARNGWKEYCKMMSPFARWKRKFDKWFLNGMVIENL